jgi:hypothetical protein
MVPPNPRTIIPLMPGAARPRGERRATMQQAVIEVVRHLVLTAVPPEHRTPLFDQARDLLSEAGWGLDELFEALTGSHVHRRIAFVVDGVPVGTSSDTAAPKSSRSAPPKASDLLGSHPSVR